MTDEELEKMAEEAEGVFTRRLRSLSDFRYDEQQEKFWDITTGNLLGGKSVDGAIPPERWPEVEKNHRKTRIRPSIAINSVDTGLTVEGSTWWPGRPVFIEDVVVGERGAMELKGAVCYNSYMPPDRSKLPSGGDPGLWIDHVKKLWPDPVEHEHFFDFAAHMIQRPFEKVNHGIVMAGAQGIGKDTALLPLRRGVGEWNAAEIGPDAVTSAYNGYIKSVLLIINEVRPHDEDFKASNFYNLLKPILAAPPEMLPMTLKYANTIYVRNLCHVVLTTNDPLTMFIPAEDRRLMVMNSPLPDPKENPVFSGDYFERMYEYLEDNGVGAVVKWLAERDILLFNSANPPPMTRGKRAIIESANQVRRGFLDEIFETYSEVVFEKKTPKIIFQKDLIQFVLSSEMFDDQKAAVNALNAKNAHFKMAERGYDMVKNPDGSEWRHGKFRSRMAFCHRSVPHEQQVEQIRAELQRRPLAMGEW